MKRLPSMSSSWKASFSSCWLRSAPKRFAMEATSSMSSLYAGQYSIEANPLAQLCDVCLQDMFLRQIELVHSQTCLHGTKHDET